MMGFIGLCAFICICSSVIILISKREKELSTLISSVLYILVMIYAVSSFSGVLEALKGHLNVYDLFPDLNLLIKICGIGLVCAIASSICESEGQKGLSLAVEIFAMIEILRCGMPTLIHLFSNALKLLGE